MFRHLSKHSIPIRIPLRRLKDFIDFVDSFKKSVALGGMLFTSHGGSSCRHLDAHIHVKYSCGCTYIRLHCACLFSLQPHSQWIVPLAFDSALACTWVCTNEFRTKNVVTLSVPWRFIAVTFNVVYFACLSVGRLAVPSASRRHHL